MTDEQSSNSKANCLDASSSIKPQEEEESNAAAAAAAAPSSTTWGGSLWSSISAVVADSRLDTATTTTAKQEENLDADLDDLMQENEESSSTKQILSFREKEDFKTQQQQQQRATLSPTPTPQEEQEQNPEELVATLEHSLEAAEAAVTSAFTSTFAGLMTGPFTGSGSSSSSSGGGGGAETKVEQQQRLGEADTVTSPLLVRSDSDDPVAREVDAVVEQATAVATSLFSTFTEKSGNLLQAYNSKVNQAAEWIDTLELQATNNDPFKQIKESLEHYLQSKKQQQQQDDQENNGEATYEEWIVKWIDMDDHDYDDNNRHPDNDKTTFANLDPQYYAEQSPHRKVWNERNHEDGSIRTYVKAQQQQQQHSLHRHQSHPIEEEQTDVITFDCDDYDDDDDTTSKPLIADPLNAQEDTSNRKELVHTEPLFVEESQKVSATVDESPFSSNVLAEEVKVVDDYQEETLDDLLADLDED